MPCPCLLVEIQAKETGASVMDFSIFLVSLMASAPALVLWIAVVVFAAVMLRRGGGRAERFLIAGASLKIISNLLILPSFAIRNWLMQEGYSMDYANSVVSGYGIFCKVVGMAGIICLVYAFWVKFRTKNFGVPTPLINRPQKGKRKWGNIYGLSRR